MSKDVGMACQKVCKQGRDDYNSEGKFTTRLKKH